MRVIICAGNQEEARNCASRFDLHGHDWKYASSPSVLEGVRNAEVILTGSFMNRPDANQILGMLTTVVSLGNRIGPLRKPASDEIFNALKALRNQSPSDWERQ